MDTKLKVGIAGAGAVGCYLGGRLASVGANVALLARERVANELATHGLRTVDMQGHRVALGAREVRVGTHPSILEDCDVILCCVKSAQTTEIAEHIRRFIRDDTCVVSLQNGLANAVLLGRGLGRTAARGIVTFNVRPLGQGLFQQATSGPLVIENMHHPTMDALSDLLSDANFDVQVTDDIEALQWSKLMMNLNNAISALSNVTTYELLLSRDYRRILADLIEEGLAVTDAAEIRLARLGAFPVRWFPFVLRLPTGVFSALAKAQLKIDPQARSSMWEDLSNRRITEIDFLNGEIVRLAERHGVAAPLNRKIVELVHSAELDAEGSPNLSAESLKLALNDYSGNGVG